MFDKLVESTKQKQASRSGRFFFLTGLLYSMLLCGLAIWTVMGFSPSLAESVDLARLTPPVPYQAPPPPALAHVSQRAAVAYSNAVPTGKNEIPKPTDVPSLPRPERACLNCVVGGPIGPGSGLLIVDSFPNSSDSGVPVPPPPKPKPTPEPTPEVKATPKPLTKVSEGVVQGLALRKVSPVYPAIAKAAHAAGPVQVQIVISEEGRVIAADVLSGNPLLRQAALDAARQWVFRPTLLSQVPVKVQGVLTFNFTLN